MPIYTRSGDQGDTGLFGGGRVGKDHARVDAYGEIDELNAALGVARAARLGELDALVEALQGQLFTLGAVLATPPGSKAASAIPALRAEWVAQMEAAIDGFESELAPLRTFVLPGGTPAAAALHLARTVCRRAERRVVPLVREGQVGAEAVVYLNRLSDLLFVMARFANLRAGVADVSWVPPRE